MMTIMKARNAITLVEMMVVVAVVGILSTFVVPQYRKYTARARQTAAKIELSTIYSAEKAFQTTYRTFTYEWTVMGFVPNNMTLAAGVYPVSADKNRFYCSTPSLVVAPLPLTHIELGLAEPTGTFGTSGYPPFPGNCPIVALAPDCMAQDAALGGTTAWVSREAFVINALGCPLKPLSALTGIDRWSINENRVLTNITSGLM
jgi:type IV pilus assembly protein PilA